MVGIYERETYLFASLLQDSVIKKHTFNEHVSTGDFILRFNYTTPFLCPEFFVIFSLTIGIANQSDNGVNQKKKIEKFVSRESCQTVILYGFVLNQNIIETRERV